MQVVEHGETGLLVPPGEVQPLCSALADLLGDPQRACRMGQAGSVRVEALYGAGKQADEHLALYRREWRKMTGEN
jgi:glycosyltransferase involved in cell wall biosynthesis